MTKVLMIDTKIGWSYNIINYVCIMCIEHIIMEEKLCRGKLQR